MAALEDELRAVPALRRLTRDRVRVLARLLEEARFTTSVLGLVGVQSSSGDERIARSVVDEWRARRRTALELLRRELPAGVDVEMLVAGATPATPIVTPATPAPRATPTMPPPRVTPATPAPTVDAALAAKKTAEYKRFSEAVAATAEAVRVCLLEGGGSATAAPAARADAVRARIGALVDGLKPARTTFVAAYAAATRADAVPSAEALERAEAAARAAIERVCAREATTTNERVARELAAARRCEPGAPTLPADVAAFVRGDGRYRYWLDRRVYCYTGDEVTDEPGTEDVLALPPTALAPALPRVGASIGPSGFVVALKNARYIGIGFPESEDERRRRLDANTSLGRELVLAAARALAAAWRAAVAFARTLVAALGTAVSVATAAARAALDSLLARLAEWRARLVLLVIEVAGSRAAATLLGVLVNRSTFAAVRAVALTAPYLMRPALASALFVAAAAGAIELYRTTEYANERERMHARAVLAGTLAALSSAYFGVAETTRALAVREYPPLVPEPLGEGGGGALVPIGGGRGDALVPVGNGRGDALVPVGGGGGGGGAIEPLDANAAFANATIRRADVDALIEAPVYARSGPAPGAPGLGELAVFPDDAGGDVEPTPAPPATPDLGDVVRAWGPVGVPPREPTGPLVLPPAAELEETLVVPFGGLFDAFLNGSIGVPPIGPLSREQLAGLMAQADARVPASWFTDVTRALTGEALKDALAVQALAGMGMWLATSTAAGAGLVAVGPMAAGGWLAMWTVGAGVNFLAGTTLSVTLQHVLGSTSAIVVTKEGAAAVVALDRINQTPWLTLAESWSGAALGEAVARTVRTTADAETVAKGTAWLARNGWTG